MYLSLAQVYSEGIFSFCLTTKAWREGNSVLLQHLRETFGREPVGDTEGRLTKCVSGDLSILGLMDFFFPRVCEFWTGCWDGWSLCRWSISIPISESSFKVNRYLSCGQEIKLYACKKVLMFTSVCLFEIRYFHTVKIHCLRPTTCVCVCTHVSDECTWCHREGILSTYSSHVLCTFKSEKLRFLEEKFGEMLRTIFSGGGRILAIFIITTKLISVWTMNGIITWICSSGFIAGF